MARSAWSQLEQAEPPDLLDQAVLNAARRAAERPVRRRAARWLGALATAAVVVLTLSIVIRQDPQGPAPPVPATDGFELELRAAREAPVQSEEASPQALNKAALAPRQDTPARDEMATPAAVQEAPSEQDKAVREPKAWVKHMLQLKAEGLDDQLDRELAAFRTAYPDFALPPELAE